METGKLQTSEWENNKTKSNKYEKDKNKEK